jgi:hypothetical protein
MISIETTTKLLKLHLAWPERKQYDGKEEEPMAFFKWLFVNHHDKPEFQELDNVSLIEEFLEKNRHVLWPSRKEEEKWANLRLEPRIDNDVEVELTVVECDEISLIGTTVAGRTVDIGLHGMRMTVSEAMPVASILKLVVSKDNLSYSLLAELRWCTTIEQGSLIGIKLIVEKDFDRWQTDFGRVFVAPVLGRKSA